MEIINRRQTDSVGDFVYQTIKENILNLKLMPKQRVSEQEISNLLDVSRTPVREAFINLAKEGLVYVLPQRGTFISPIDLDKVEQARFIRTCLEIPVLKIAIDCMNETHHPEFLRNLELQKQAINSDNYVEMLQLDQHFHELIFKIAGKMMAWNIIEQNSVHYRMIRLLSYKGHINLSKVLNQHHDLFKAMINKDKETAVKIIQIHIEKLRADKELVMSEFPEFFN